MDKITLHTDPELTKATVRTFSGESIQIDVERVWFYRGVPERIWGGGFKFKADEEPFTLTFQEQYPEKEA